jgi:hypothetical protein
VPFFVYENQPECEAMKKLTFVFVLMALSSSSFANGGQITFRGAIVETGCDTLIVHSQIKQSCIRGNKTEAATLRLDDSQQPLPFRLGTMQLKKVGNYSMMTVSYY